MTATQQLNRRLLTGDRPRCSDPADHQLWTSEHQQDQDLAAKWCTGCITGYKCCPRVEEQVGPDQTPGPTRVSLLAGSALAESERAGGTLRKPVELPRVRGSLNL
jgi:hypothetical protein